MINPRRAWFLERIGKTVYRKSRDMDIPSARKNGYTSVLIIDEQHAGYLCDLEGAYIGDGDELRYYDTAEEVTKNTQKNEGLD